MVVVVARKASLPSGASAFSLTVTTGSGLPSVGAVWAQLLNDAASMSAPSGSREESGTEREGLCAKMASKRKPA